MSLSTSHTLKSFREQAKPIKKTYARSLRANTTKSEQRLWRELGSKKLGFKFRRQVIIFGWIVDFYCVAQKLAIELDGHPHRLQAQKEKDTLRDKKMSSAGIRVVRIQSSRVFDDMPQVLRDIRKALRVMDSDHQAALLDRTE